MSTTMIDIFSGIFVCFKRCNGHMKERIADVASINDSRNSAHTVSVSKQQQSNNQYGSNSNSSESLAAGSITVQENTILRRQWPRTDPTASSSSTSTPTQVDFKDPADREIPSIISVGLGPNLRSSCCSHGSVPFPSLPAIHTLPCAGRFADTQFRTPTPTMLLSLRNLHMALAPMDCAAKQQQQLLQLQLQQHSPLTNDSPSGDVRPSSIDFTCGIGFGELTTSDSSGNISMSGINPQLRFVPASKLGEEVQDLQVIGRGGYGMVMTGNWKQEGRVAVKVLLSDEDKWVESCYKEAVLSRLLAHPNILQTYNFQIAVLTHADVARAKVSWEQQQQLQNQPHHHRTSQQGHLEDDPSSTTKMPYSADTRADSFELLPPLCSTGGSCAYDRLGATSTSVDFWGVLFMLGAKPGQFVTLIIMEYAEVGTLQRAIAAGAFRESSRLSKWAALRSLLVTAKEIAGGMCLLHSYKIIHGDLSATNVMLRASRIDKRGFVAKVADFGLSKVTLNGVVRTEDWAGQAQYLAPECLDHEARLASDVFAFGVLLYELATGGRAFGEYAPVQILAGRLAGDLALRWPADVSPGVRALAERCMQQDPEARPAFREVVDDLRRQDLEAKAQHRQQTVRRRYTADGLAAGAAATTATAASATATAAATAMTVAAAAAAVAGVTGTVGRMPSPLGPYRFTPAVYCTSGDSAAPPAAASRPRTTSLACTPRGVNGCSPSAVLPYRSNLLRHSFTTGSTGLAVAPTGSAEAAAAAAASGLGRAVTSTSVVVPASVVMSSPPEAVVDTFSEFTAMGLRSVSSRTLVGVCPSEECSGRLCTSVPYTGPHLLPCHLELIPSGNVCMYDEFPDKARAIAFTTASVGGGGALVFGRNALSPPS
ncbi:hypothetical protein Vafri_13943 [Volvox africanus]|uniref:Protein kinase domain-containing protein n=1 Tax=Volvox africanus TaxID=51714 RepID=A0A8J4F439_9CHLO|nr:hypothetical protein Vafri_13943 [Volvox africanus]